MNRRYRGWHNETMFQTRGPRTDPPHFMLPTRACKECNLLLIEIRPDWRSGALGVFPVAWLSIWPRVHRFKNMPIVRPLNTRTWAGGGKIIIRMQELKSLQQKCSSIGVVWPGLLRATIVPTWSGMKLSLTPLTYRHTLYVDCNLHGQALTSH